MFRRKWNTGLILVLLSTVLFWVLLGCFISKHEFCFYPPSFVARLTSFMSQNWTTVFLIISEFAAFLPGPWNGIIQSITRAIVRNAQKNKVNN